VCCTVVCWWWQCMRVLHSGVLVVAVHACAAQCSDVIGVPPA
jgi:hypothetical protein